jgi:hypothetical protein
MFTLDLIVKYSPVPLSVEKKEESEAQALYDKILSAMEADKPQVIELTCDKQKDKKIAIISDQISGVILSQKSGAAATGKAPGFLSAIADNS